MMQRSIFESILRLIDEIEAVDDGPPKWSIREKQAGEGSEFHGTLANSAKKLARLVFGGMGNHCSDVRAKSSWASREIGGG